MNLTCWWFGCDSHPDDPAPVEFLECQRCSKIIDYDDLAGMTRCNMAKDWLIYYFFRKWIPEKCTYCGKRYGRHDDADHIPF